jgi:curved DNA-binding protein CbpA
MFAHEILGVEPNATPEQIKLAYRRKIKDLNDTDHDFEKKLNMYQKAFSILTSLNSEELVGYRSKSFFDDFFGFTFPNPFKYFDMLNNNMYNIDTIMNKKFDKSQLDDTNKNNDHVQKDNMNNFVNTVELENKDQHNKYPTSYIKYVHNYTTIKNGKRQSDSFSTVEKVINGQKQIARKRVFDDGENIHIDQLLPDGKNKTTTYKKPTIYKINHEKIE